MNNFDLNNLTIRKLVQKIILMVKNYQILKILDLIPGKSTSNIIEKVKAGATETTSN